MTGRDRVSVVTIFFNEDRFLAQAVTSVLSQTYGDWELLLVDDGSTDGSTEVAKRYAAQYPSRVRYLEHPGHANRGMSASRNLAIRCATGRYLAFLDGDDVWLPHALERQLALLTSHGSSGMVCGATQYWFSWTGTPEDAGRDYYDFGSPDANRSVRLPPPRFLSRLLSGGPVPCMCSVLVRREVVERVGGFEDSFRGLFEDQVLLAKIALDCPIVVSHESWARYRQHAGSACAVAARAGTKRQARRVFLRWVASHLSAHHVTDPELWRAHRRSLWALEHPRLQRAADGAQKLWRRLDASARIRIARRR